MLGGASAYVSPLSSTRNKAKLACKPTPSPLRSARQRISNPPKHAAAGSGHGNEAFRPGRMDRDEELPRLLPSLHGAVSSHARDAWVTPRKPGEDKAAGAPSRTNFDSWDEWKRLEMLSQDYLSSLSSPHGGDKPSGHHGHSGQRQSFSMEKAIEVLETIVQENTGLSQDAKHKVDALQAEAGHDKSPQQQQQSYMEQMYQTIQMLRGELEQALRTSDSNDHQQDAKAALDELNALEHDAAETSFETIEDTAVTVAVDVPSHEEPKPVRRGSKKSIEEAVEGSPAPSKEPPPPKQLDIHARGPKLEQEYCNSLGKNVELQLRNQKLARQMNQANDELVDAQAQNLSISQQLQRARQQLDRQQKQLKFFSKEATFLKNELLTAKMQHVELYHQMARNQKSFAQANAQLQQQVDTLSQENHFLTCEISETKCLMRFQSDKMHEVIHLAKQEKQKLVCCIAETRLKFKEWKENESSTLKAARDQAVHNLKTEYELKITRHQEEKQKLRDKVKDLEVSLRLLQRDRNLSPLELSQRKAAILSGGNNTNSSVRNIIGAPASNGCNNNSSSNGSNNNNNNISVKWQATNNNSNSFSGAQSSSSSIGSSTSPTWNPNGFSTCEAELIAAQSKIKELEALLEHAKDYQRRQDHIIQVSETTISRLVQEREAAALESLSNSSMLSNVISTGATSQSMGCGATNSSCYVPGSVPGAYSFATRAQMGVSTPLEYLPSNSPKRTSTIPASQRPSQLIPTASAPHLNILNPNAHRATTKGAHVGASNAGNSLNLPRLDNPTEPDKPRTPSSELREASSSSTRDHEAAAEANDLEVPIEFIKRRTIVAPEISFGSAPIDENVIAEEPTGPIDVASSSSAAMEAAIATAVLLPPDPNGVVDPEKEMLRRTSMALSAEVEKYRNLVVQSHREIQALKDTNARRRSQIANVISAGNDAHGNLVLTVLPQQLLVTEQQQVPLGGGGSMTSREKFLTEEVTRLSIELEKIRSTRSLGLVQVPAAAVTPLTEPSPRTPVPPPLKEEDDEEQQAESSSSQLHHDDKAVVIQRRYKTHLARKEFKEKQQAADKIKARYRGYLVRQNTQIIEPKTRAILTITIGMQRKIESLPCHFHTTLSSYGKKFPAQIRVSRNPPLMLVQVDGHGLEQQKRYVHLYEVLSVLPSRRHGNADDLSPEEIAQAIAPMLRLVQIGQKMFRVVIRKSSEAHLNIHSDISSSSPVATSASIPSSSTTPTNVLSAAMYDPHAGAGSKKKIPEPDASKTIRRKLTGPMRENSGLRGSVRPAGRGLAHFSEDDEREDDSDNDAEEDVEQVKEERQLELHKVSEAAPHAKHHHSLSPSKQRPVPTTTEKLSGTLSDTPIQAADEMIAMSPRGWRTKTNEFSNSCLKQAAMMDYELVSSIHRTSLTSSAPQLLPEQMEPELHSLHSVTAMVPTPSLSSMVVSVSKPDDTQDPANARQPQSHAAPPPVTNPTPTAVSDPMPTSNALHPPSAPCPSTSAPPLSAPAQAPSATPRAPSMEEQGAPEPSTPSKSTDPVASEPPALVVSTPNLTSNAPSAEEQSIPEPSSPSDHTPSDPPTSTAPSTPNETPSPPFADELVVSHPPTSSTDPGTSEPPTLAVAPTPDPMPSAPASLVQTVSEPLASDGSIASEPSITTEAALEQVSVETPGPQASTSRRRPPAAPSEHVHKGRQLSENSNEFIAELLDHPANIKQFKMIKKRGRRMRKSGDYVLISLFLLGLPTTPSELSTTQMELVSRASDDVVRVHLYDSEAMQEFACDFTPQQLGFLWSHDDEHDRKRIVNHLDVERISHTELKLTVLPHSIENSPVSSTACLALTANEMTPPDLIVDPLSPASGSSETSHAQVTTVDQVKATASHFVDQLYASILVQFQAKEQDHASPM